jgi:hypothetical protein
MDEKKIHKMLKSMKLQKGHYYVIITDIDDDKFNMVAYDTTGRKYHDEGDHSVGSITHEGLVALLRNRGDDIFNYGMGELSMQYASKRLFSELPDDTGQKIEYKDNVIKVDFTSEH